MRDLLARLSEVRARVHEGGGPEAASRHRARGKLTARERIGRLVDPGTPILEIGLFAAHGMKPNSTDTPTSVFLPEALYRRQFERAALAEGDVFGDTVECPRHGSAFDLRTGAALSLPATHPVPAYPAEVEGNDVFVDLGEEDR